MTAKTLMNPDPMTLGPSDTVAAAADRILEHHLRHLPVVDEQGRYRYKLVDGAVVERTPEELAADVIPAQPPSDAERLDTLEGLIVDTQYQLALTQLGLAGEV